jgi:hypothetical protein
MKKIFISVVVMASLAACEEPYHIEQDASEVNIVIEGLLTNREDMQYIKVSRTADFYTDGEAPRVSDAIVSVTDDLGNVLEYVHNPNNSEDSLGYYFPANAFAGEIGRTYELSVVVDGTTFNASDRLLSITPIDSLTIRLDAEEQADPEDQGRFYEVLIFVKEPQDEENFYLFKFYRNDSLSFDNHTDIYYSDDKLLQENIDGIPAPSHFAFNDLARVEAYSLSRQGYVFYNDLSSLLNNDSGGMFGPIPSTPRTNLTNGALGFFQVSAVAVDEIIVE